MSRTEGLTSRGRNTDAKKSELLNNNVEGGFTPEVYQELTRNKRLAGDIIQDLLIANFPETLHQDILDAVSLDFSATARIIIPRSAEFRDRVLRAYEYSCAVCSFDLRLGSVLVAVEAAHIKWHQAGGPDEESERFSSLHTAP